MPTTGHRFCFLVVYIHAVLWAWQVTVEIGLLITINDLAFNNESSLSRQQYKEP